MRERKSVGGASDLSGRDSLGRDRKVRSGLTAGLGREVGWGWDPGGASRREAPAEPSVWGGARPLGTSGAPPSVGGSPSFARAAEGVETAAGGSVGRAGPGWDPEGSPRRKAAPAQWPVRGTPSPRGREPGKGAEVVREGGPESCGRAAGGVREPEGTRSEPKTRGARRDPGRGPGRNEVAWRARRT